MKKTNTKTTQRAMYTIENWHDYNKSLIQRGSINFWFENNIEDLWYEKSQAKRPGRQYTYSDYAITICLTVKVLYKLTYRQTEGFVGSIFKLLKPELAVPSYTQIERRSKKINIPLKRKAHKGPIDIVIDSTGLKVYGEGEWKVRQHGTSKRRTWKKLHLAVDPLDNEIVSMALTPSNYRDDIVFSSLIDASNEPVERIFADGAYDTGDCYRESYERGCHLIAPPKSNAVVQKEKQKVPWLETRDQAVQRIEELKKTLDLHDARSQWKHEADYHNRSLGETAMYRFKQLLGNSLYSLTEATQLTEVKLKVNILNKFSELGMPLTMRALP